MRARPNGREREKETDQWEREEDEARAVRQLRDKDGSDAKLGEEGSARRFARWRQLLGYVHGTSLARRRSRSVLAAIYFRTYTAVDTRKTLRDREITEDRPRARTMIARP